MQVPFFIVMTLSLQIESYIMKFFLTLTLTLTLPFSFYGMAHATETPNDIVGQTVAYKDGDTALEGYYVPSRCGDLKESYPTVMIVHQWKGITDNEKMRAEMLSRQCYNAFAIDMYGKDIRPTTMEGAKAESTKYKTDADLALGRMDAALKYLSNRPHVDMTKIAAIGYCFGGGMVLELARSGADIKAVGSFHGALSSAIEKYDPKEIKAAITVYHGSDDPYISEKELSDFTKEMFNQEIIYDFVPYSGAVHAFTQIEAGTDNSTGAAYNIDADRSSWAHLLSFLDFELNS